MGPGTSKRLQYVGGIASIAVIACLFRGVQLDVHWSDLLVECLLVAGLSLSAFLTSATAADLGDRF